MKQILYRAADDDIITDCGSFSETRAAAEAYLSNPGFGGRNLYRATVEIDPAKLLDLTDDDDPVATIARIIGQRHPGAIGADEYTSRVSGALGDAGYEWVRVRESYPADTITWTWLGVGDDPEMEEIE